MSKNMTKYFDSIQLMRIFFFFFFVYILKFLSLKLASSLLALDHVCSVILGEMFEVADDINKF